MTFNRDGRFGFIMVAVLIASLLLMPIPFIPQVSAADADSLDLSIGDSESTPWNIDSVKPGDTGTEFVELTNQGSIDGYVIIWISNIVGTDGSDDGAALADYFRLTVEADGLNTTTSFPALIGDLPSTPSDFNKIVIENLTAHSSVQLTWTWEFYDNGLPQNEAQGDGLTFTINYLLAESVPNVELSWTIVDVLGHQTVVPLDNDGTVLDSIKASDSNGTVSLVFPQGAQILTEDDLVPSLLVLSVFNMVPELGNETQASPVYRLIAYKDDIAIEVSFSRQVGLIVGLEPIDQTHVANFYMLVDGLWTRLPDVGTSTSWEAHGLISGTGFFVAAIVENTEEGPFIYASDLMLKLKNEHFWWPLTFMTVKGASADVTVLVTNYGDQSGNFTLLLMMDGEMVKVRVIEMAAGESRTVTFHLSDLPDGEHEMRVGGLEGSFETKSEINWLLIIILIVIITAIIVLVWYLVKWRGGKMGDNRYLIT
jgi:hypothetical protein